MAAVRECTIDYEETETNDTYLVSFSNGVLRLPTKENIVFKTYECKSTADGLKRRFSRKILVSTTEHMDYVGQNYGPSAIRFGNLCKYYVGILNKKTGKMRVQDAEYFQLQPFLQEPEEDNSEKDEDLTTFEKNSRFVFAFGHQKAKRNLEKKAKTYVSTDALQGVMAAVESNLSEAPGLEDPNLDQGVSSTSTLIPPQNKEATSVSEVYQLCDIISDKENAALETQVHVFINATKEDIRKWKEEKTYPEYVLYFLSSMVGGMLNSQKAKILMYYTYLMEIYNLKWSDIRKKDPLPNVPNPMKNCILDRFTVMGTMANGRPIRSLPQMMREKMLAYALVLVLFAENFQISMSKLLQDFRIKPARLTMIANALGCYTSMTKGGDGSDKKIELKLPLFEMRVKGRRGKGKR